jgi:hypothetical protein
MQLANLKQLSHIVYAGIRRTDQRRHMTKLIGNWQMNGKVYAIPLYSNPLDLVAGRHSG